jgi:hypothetical protein
MSGEIFFDMTREYHSILGMEKFLLKRWKKHTIYVKSGPYAHTENPKDNTFLSSSIYLYDYVIVSQEWFNSMVYTSDTIDGTPSLDVDNAPGNLWYHRKNTFKNSPNAIVNNYIWRYNPEASIVASRPIYGYAPSKYDAPASQEWKNELMKTPIYKDTGEYFEIVNGYPRNHFTHKRDLFSLFSEKTYNLVNKTIINGIYTRNKQNKYSTIGRDGLEDGSLPVEPTQVGNVNLVQTNNVINQ